MIYIYILSLNILYHYRYYHYIYIHGIHITTLIRVIRGDIPIYGDQRYSLFSPQLRPLKWSKPSLKLSKSTLASRGFPVPFFTGGVGGS